MCLILTVRLSDSDTPNAPEIRRAAGLQKCAEDKSFSGLFRKQSPNFGIPGPEGGCGCSFLADSADWNAPTWDMIPSTLVRLSTILRVIRQKTTGGFIFEALWIGESPASECRLTIGDLVRLVETSKLGTKTRYFVE
jgi:hypothetical protein